MSANPILHDAAQSKPSWNCASCTLRERCFPAGLSEGETARVEQVVVHNRSVERHGAVCRAGTPFRFIYAIRSGYVKGVVGQDDGREQVTGVYMPGEWIGMDAIGTGTYKCDFVALLDSNVCAIPFVDLERLSREIPVLQRHFERALSREIARSYGMMLWLGSLEIEERIALFLLNLSERYAAQGNSPTHFNVLLTRHEMGSYLGARLETVSRVLSRFQEQGLIAVEHKDIVIKNLEQLERMLEERPESARSLARRTPPLAHAKPAPLHVH